MSRPRKKKKLVRITSIIAAVIFILAISLLVFATVVRSNPDMTLFGCRFYYVLTGSMEPDIRQGSLIVAKKTPLDELKVGDTISFISHDPSIEGMINSHKIVAIEVNEEGKTEITTKGTANTIQDEYKVYPEDIKGKVVFKSYFMGKAFKLLSNRTVSFCVTVLPIAVIVLINLIDLFVIISTPENKQKATETDSTDTDSNINGDNGPEESNSSVADNLPQDKE